MADSKRFFNLVLVGKTGNGKSATGNTILGRSVFKCSNNAGSITKGLMLESVETENYQLNVLDTPGLFDTDKSTSNNDILKKLLDVMSYCPEGIDGFFLVIKCVDRFTEEEFKTFCILKEFFGPDFLKICTVIFTFGDLYENDDQTAGKPFEYWLQESMKTNEQLRILITDCENRSVLIYNNKRWMEKRDHTMDRILSIIKQRKKPYTHGNFKKAEQLRQKTVVEDKLPQLQAKYQRALSLIGAILEKAELCSNSVSKEENVIIVEKIDELITFIDEKDLGTEILKDFKERVSNLRVMFNKQSIFGEKVTKMKEYLDLLKNPPHRSKTFMTAVSLIIFAASTAISAIGALIFPPLVSGTLALGLNTGLCFKTIVEYENECEEYRPKMEKLERELMN